ncbi:G-protein alpha subunit [Dentipellis sp. KUC8613]|nr:G-protein alpha subunit [Dentipellis sp. KUC8613]
MSRRPSSQPEPSSSARTPMPSRVSAIADEAEARRISAAIDEQLRQEREQIRKRQTSRRDVKVMLLGQAESGKSTLQKQFQLYYSSQTLDQERPSWRPIVYFNIIKAVRTILDELDYEFSTSDQSFSSLVNLGPNWPDEITRLRTKLLPLISIEDSLAAELSNGVSISSGGRAGVYVRAGWQALVTPTRAWPLTDIRNSLSSGKAGIMANMAAKHLSETSHDVRDLWQHPAVRALLRLRKLKLEESASFFLDEVYRLAQPDYLPTTEDLLHVRLQTLGVTEHAFDINFGGGHYNWLLYDVGGARGQRHAWVPYFDDATAIIFLAPISAFDQYLEEDPRTNRIDDSLQLFSAICTNKLLKNSSLVLMLNKTDLLKRKLQAGIEVRKYITSYGERANRYEDVAEYFRAHFVQIHKRKSQSRQTLFVHFTSMLDITATQKIIVDVNESIIRSYLGQSGLA